MEPLNIKQLLIRRSAHALAAILNYGEADIIEAGFEQQALFAWFFAQFQQKFLAVLRLELRENK
jgi:hypothetical protein